MEFNYISKPVRTAGILTTSYVAGTVLEDLQSQDKLVLLVDFTKDSLTTAEVKVEYSTDNTNWFQESAKTNSSGTISEALALHQFSADGKYYVPLDMKARYARVSAKGTGTVTGSSMAITAIIGQDL